jgi:tRNA threonylcarbamoyl adenosine modification protein YjeE
MNQMAAEAMRETAAQTIWQKNLDDETATAALAEDVAALIGAGDLVTLSGDLGTGKTTFARALIRALTGEPDLEVPSPTFTLMQVYEGISFPIVHADLFRINRPEDLGELGWEEAAEGALVLVEWPERAEDVLNADRLDIDFSLNPSHGPSFRSVTITGIGAFASRLGRAKAIQEIIEKSGWRSAERHFMQGDASTRIYERLIKPNGERALLMISPPHGDGPPIRFGKPYSAIARLAEDIRPYIAIDQGLRAQGFSAPKIFASDLTTGLAIVEDLGTGKITDDGGIIQERYAWAVTALVALHGADLPESLPVTETETYRIPPYDADALLIEIELLLEWYAPHIAKAHLSSGTKASFLNLWRHVLHDIASARQTWTLRDYHSPNIIWMPERDGVGQVGIIDFQDCVLGHPAYDVAALLQDARITVPDDVELKLLGHYARLRWQKDPDFDMAGFARAYAILGAQRATKILGIFARLDKRDHKPAYLVHLPRIEKYLLKGLAHPALADLKLWYEMNLPGLFKPASYTTGHKG